MKKWIIICLLIFAVAASAEDFHDTVFVQFYQALDSLKHKKIEVTPATFKLRHSNKTYAGYEIVFETKWSLLDKDTDPMSMFRPFKGNYWYNTGWRADIRYDADGPGSTHFLIRNGEFFCTIRWEYTAYIDDKGEHITGDVLWGRIRCATETIEKEE